MQLPDIKYQKTIDEQLVNKLTWYIQSCCKKTSKIIIEINQSINSLAAAMLFKKVLGENAIAIIFDFNGNLTSICKNLGLNTFLLNRKAAYQKELTAYRFHKQQDIYGFYQRFTSYHLQIQAGIMKAEIADTIDKSDRLTKKRPNCFYGSFMLFYSFFKTEVYALAKFLSLDQSAIDCDYWKQIDPILYLLTEKQMNPEQISQEFKIDLLWLKKLKSHIDKKSLITPVNQFII